MKASPYLRLALVHQLLQTSIEPEGSIAQWLVFLPPDPVPSGSIPSITKNLSKEKVFNVAEVNQMDFLDGNGQRLENVDRTHQVLASGKLVLQIRTSIGPGFNRSFSLLFGCFQTENSFRLTVF